MNRVGISGIILSLFPADAGRGILQTSQPTSMTSSCTQGLRHFPGGGFILLFLKLAVTQTLGKFNL